MLTNGFFEIFIGDQSRLCLLWSATDTEIILEKNPGNTGGHYPDKTYIAGIIYKVVLPVALTSPENYVLVVSSGDGKNYKSFDQKEKGRILTEYENDTTSFFLFLK